MTPAETAAEPPDPRARLAAALRAILDVRAEHPANPFLPELDRLRAAEAASREVLMQIYTIAATALRGEAK